jgi:hypothetical protein
MNNQHDSKFTLGLLLGLIVGGGAVFLFGTRTGKNILKIISEQGLDGILNLLEEYNFDDLAEYEEVESEEEADLQEEHQEGEESSSAQSASERQGKEGSNKESKPSKKRFFKKIRK